MTYRALRLWLGCTLVCHASLAQANAVPDTDDDENVTPAAQVRLQPALRGDLAVHIVIWGMPGANLDRIRQGSLRCDWRRDKQGQEFLDGVCRKYLRSDGTSAQGSLALAPLVAALRNAGAQNVLLELSDNGVPLDPAPKEWKAQESGGRFGLPKTTAWRFWSLHDGRLPQPFEIHIGSPWSSSRLSIPFGFALFGPALLALWLRRRAERKGAVEAASVWVHWILTGMWLYWISAVSLEDLAAFALHLQLDSMVLNFVIGTVLFAGVPLAATASCIAILMRAPAGAGRRGDTRGLVMRSVAREAVLMIPFAMFLVGSGMFNQDWHVAMVSLPLAFLTYKLLSWWVGRQLLGGMEILSRGNLHGVASVIARRAGVTLGGIYIVGNRAPQEANAFAAGGKTLALTRGLVEQLTCREVVAVVGHEIGHLRGKHIATRMIAFWGYMLVVGPAAAHFIQSYHLSHLLLSLPILPLGYILGTAFLSRNHEFSADAQAVELTGDAEGMIAALARLRKLSRSPVDWGGMQGSIISHPSMRDRVLAIARRFHVPEDRALAVLHDPDLLNADTPAGQLHYSLPTECAGRDLLFTSSWRQGYMLWSHWLGYVALVGICLVLGQFALRVWPRAPHIKLALLLALPIAARMYLAFMGWTDRTAMKYLRGKLRSRMAPESADGTFVGLLPGDRVGHVDGFCLWDAGFLFLTPDTLTYRGERASFSLPRIEATKISVSQGPLAWDRDYAATVTCSEGSFSFTTPDRGTASRRQARRLERRLNGWWHGEPAGSGFAWAPALAPAPPVERALLVAHSSDLRGWRAVRLFTRHAFFLWLGLIILMPFSLIELTPAVAFVPFMAPLAYLVAYFPLFLRARPADAQVSRVAPAPVPAPAEEPAA